MKEELIINCKKVVIVNGAGGVGKDTFVNLCSEIINDNGGRTARHISAVDNIKLAAKILGWDGEKDVKSRKFLSDLKMLSIDFNDGPFESLAKEIEFFLSISKKSMLFIDIREPHEILKIESKFNVITVLIKSKRINSNYGNYSDDNVLNYHYGYVINNDGDIEQLKESAFNFLKAIFPWKVDNR